MRSAASAVLDWLRRVVPRVYFDLATVLSGAVTRNLFRGIVKLLVAGFLSTRPLGILRAVYALFKITVSERRSPLVHGERREHTSDDHDELRYDARPTTGPIQGQSVSFVWGAQRQVYLTIRKSAAGA